MSSPSSPRYCSAAEFAVVAPVVRAAAVAAQEKQEAAAIAKLKEKLAAAQVALLADVTKSIHSLVGIDITDVPDAVVRKFRRQLVDDGYVVDFKLRNGSRFYTVQLPCDPRSDDKGDGK